MNPPTKRLKVQVHLWREVAPGRRLYALFHRSPAKGDYWQPITGNVEEGESCEACALRETAEEAGVEAGADNLSPCLWVHNWSRDGVEFAEHIYGLRCDDAVGDECDNESDHESSEPIRLSPEHRAVEWLSADDALARLHFEGNRRGLALVEEWNGSRQKTR